MWNCRPNIHCLLMLSGSKATSMAARYRLASCHAGYSIAGALLLRTDQNEIGTGHHPRNIIEIATDVRLRDHYQLNDGDLVEIDLP